MVETAAEPVLRVENVSRRFGGLLAVNGASFDAGRGRITALIGPNGAGKTTLFSIISGFLKPNDGRVLFDGENIVGQPPHRLAQRGLVRTFQIVQPFPGLTVRENIAVGAHLAKPKRQDALDAAEDVARRVGLDSQIDKPAAGLTVAGRKRLELARALALKPKLLLLDEVLAGLNPSEIRDMVPVIREICSGGVTIIMIEHIMQAVMNLAQHVLVLSEGRIIAGGAPNEIADNERVVEAYLGRGAAQRMLQAGKAQGTGRGTGQAAAQGMADV
jgi:branched-chain amino acid transport system ATP-binding protein